MTQTFVDLPSCSPLTKSSEAGSGKLFLSSLPRKGNLAEKDGDLTNRSRDAMTTANGKPKQYWCADCVTYFGTVADGKPVVQVPSCSICHKHYEDLNAQLARQKGELAALSNLQAKTEMALSDLKLNRGHELEEQNVGADGSRKRPKKKVELEDAWSPKKKDLILALKKLEADMEIEHSKTEFLKVKSRDSLQADVVLSVQDQHIYAHRAFLASKSQVFRKKFEKGTPDQKPTEVFHIPCASYHVVEAVVSFCYTGEISFTELVPPDQVLAFACMCEIELLRDVCAAELCGKITVDNLPQLLKLSRTFGAKKLEEEAWKFFKEHFDDLKDGVYDEIYKGPGAPTVLRPSTSKSPPESPVS